MAFRLNTGRSQQWSRGWTNNLRKTNKLHNAVYKITKDVCHNLWRAQTALIHYA